jgi:hypothetical protein
MNSSTVRYWPSIIPHDCVERRIHFEPLLQAQIEPPTDAVLNTRPGHLRPKMRGALNRSRQLYGKTTVPAPKFLFIEPANTPLKWKKAMNYVPAGRNCQKQRIGASPIPKLIHPRFQLFHP